MGYFLTSSVENALLAESIVDPKTHTPLPQVQERGLRFYSPSCGRWLNRDPIGEGGGIALYVFVRNAAGLSYDPLGRMGRWGIEPDPDHPGEYRLTPPDWDYEVRRCEIAILAGHRTWMPRAIRVRDENKGCAAGAAYGCVTGGGVYTNGDQIIHTPPVPSPGIPNAPGQPNTGINDSELIDRAERAFQAAQAVAATYCGSPCCCKEVVIRTVILAPPPRPDHPEDVAVFIRLSRLNTVVPCPPSKCCRAPANGAAP